MPIKTEIKLTETYQLKSLQDNIGNDGNFFLGCGNIDGAIYYSYYILNIVTETMITFGSYLKERV